MAHLVHDQATKFSLQLAGISKWKQDSISIIT